MFERQSKKCGRELLQEREREREGTSKREGRRLPPLILHRFVLATDGIVLFLINS